MTVWWHAGWSEAFFLDDLGVAGGNKRVFHGFRLRFFLGLWQDGERVLRGAFVRVNLTVLPSGKVLMPRLGIVRSQRRSKPLTVALTLHFLLLQPVWLLCTVSLVRLVYGVCPEAVFRTGRRKYCFYSLFLKQEGNIPFLPSANLFL